MNRILLIKIVITVTLLLSILTTIIILSPPMTKVEDKPIIDWQTTKENMRYYITCIEGHKMIVSQRYRMAGPIGKCNGIRYKEDSDK